MKKKLRPGHRARRRQKAAIKRLKREVGRLQRQIQAQQGLLMEVKTNPNRHSEPLQVPGAAMIYASELDAVRKYVLRYPQWETGGSLFGWYSETGFPIIALATGPGKNAVHGATRFHADEDYSFAMGNLIASHGVDHLSEWHSHHKMALSHPSDIDCRAMQRALEAPTSSTRRFLCGIANITEGGVTLNTYYFMAGEGGKYRHVPLVVKEGISPVRIGLQSLLEEMEAKGE